MTTPTIPDALRLSGRKYTYAAIQAGLAPFGTAVDDYEAKVLVFVRQWLNGTQEFVLTTSGSTGTPQPITLGRKQLVASARRTGDFFGLAPGDRALVCLNCAYVGGLMMLVRGLERKMHLTVVAPHANPFEDVAAEAEFDFAAFVPLQLKAALAAGQAARLNQMKCLLVGGAPADVSLQKELQPLTVPIFLTYGMTETCSHVALRRLNGPHATDYYQVLPGIEAGQDERGCLTLRGDVTDDQLIITNDLVKLLGEQRFEWLGRADFVINSGGVKVPAEKVELALDAALVEIGEARRCFVAGLADERLGQAVTAFIEGPPLSATIEQALQHLLAQGLGRFEQPRSICYIPEFQDTATGKINRLATLQNRGTA